MHDSFENLSDYGSERLPPENFSQDNQTTEFSRCCCVFYETITNYVEVFLDQENHQEVDENYGWDTSLGVLDPEVNWLSYIEEHNDAFLTILVRNQVLSSKISHRKITFVFANYLGLPSQIFLKNHLCMVLEEWKLEHFLSCQTNG